MRQSSVRLLSNVSLGADIASPGINLISIYAYSIQVVWSGGTAPTGSFTLEGSDDSGDNGSGQGVSQPTNWTTITGSSQAITSTPGSLLYDVVECSYRWVRLVYTRTSGDGTVSAMMNTKGV